MTLIDKMDELDWKNKDKKVYVGQLNGEVIPEVCPNHYNHISAWSAFDRELCKCGKTYVRKVR